MPYPTSLEPIPTELVDQVAEILRWPKTGEARKAKIDELEDLVRQCRDMHHYYALTHLKLVQTETKRVRRAAENLVREFLAVDRQTRWCLIDRYSEWLPGPHPTDQARDDIFNWISNIQLLAEVATMPQSKSGPGRPSVLSKRLLVWYAGYHFVFDRNEIPTPTAGNEFEQVLGILWELVSGERDQSLRGAARYYWFDIFKRALKPKPGFEKGVS